MGKTKKWAGFFLPLEPRWNTKYQKFVKSKDIRKLPSKKYPQHNQKSCCIWSAVKEKQPALFLSRSVTSLFFPHCCLLLPRVFFFFPNCCKGLGSPREPVPCARGRCSGAGKAEMLALPVPARIAARTLPDTHNRTDPPSIHAYFMPLQKCWWTATQRWFHYILLSNCNKFNYRRRRWMERVGWLLQTAWFWL